MKKKSIPFANHGNNFITELRDEVNQYFASRNLSKAGDWRLWTKTIVVLVLTPVLLLLALNLPWTGITVPLWVSMVLFLVIGQLHAFTGFNVMHDACHGSFSEKPWVNKLLGNSLSLMGSHAFIWKFKHNQLHHTWTNIDGMDDDIAKAPFLRHCDTQPYQSVHRYQHWYMFLLYGIQTIFWVYINDMLKYFKKEVYGHPMPEMSKGEHLIFWLTKIGYTTIYLLVPMYFLGVGYGILAFFLVNFSLGITLSLVFQMAHAVEHCHFENAAEYQEKGKKLPNEWAVHQVITTSNFATNSALVTFCTGGLNFQVEHHLFPQVSHVHYPEINKILKRMCAKHGVDYKEYPTFSESILSHIRYMKAMGQAPVMLAAG